MLKLMQRRTGARERQPSGTVKLDYGLKTVRLSQQSGKRLLTDACRRRSWLREVVFPNLSRSLFQSLITQPLWQDGKQRY